jgi:dTDP-4-dehydrorhamnose 3,5-epimerase
LDARSPKLVYIAPGFGHAFLSTEDNTIQLFAIDEFFDKEEKGVISYKDPEIGLKLPVEDIIISDYDREV